MIENKKAKSNQMVMIDEVTYVAANKKIQLKDGRMIDIFKHTTAGLGDSQGIFLTHGQGSIYIGDFYTDITAIFEKISSTLDNLEKISQAISDFATTPSPQPGNPLAPPISATVLQIKSDVMQLNQDVTQLKSKQK